MSFDMFWGGAPAPEQTGPEETAVAAAAGDEFNYDEESEDSSIEHAFENPHTDTRLPKTARLSKKKRRVAGGIAPIAKKITIDYDSDDARIIELKQQLYTDEQVAQTLVDEGRVRYQAKTVGSRWIRLRRILLEKEDELLDDELTDWHMGEDDDLNDITDAVEKKYQELREKMEEKKWKDVSQHLAQKLGRRKYTGKACRERFFGLKDGSALVPIEMDDDQSGRARMREERIAKAKKDRQDAKDAALKAEEDKENAIMAKKREQAEAAEKRAAAESKRKAEKAERARIALERKTNKEVARNRRLAVLEQMRAERDWLVDKARAEKNIYRQLIGKPVVEKKTRTGGKKAKGAYDSDEEEELIDDFESDEEELMTDFDDDEDDAEAVFKLDAHSVPTKTPRRRSGRTTRKPPSTDRPRPTNIVDEADDADDDDEPFSEKKKATVTPESLLNPRSILSDSELVALLHFREMPRRFVNESHAEVVARINAHDYGLDNDDLDGLLQHAGEKTKGKKADKVRRLQRADATTSDAGQMGRKATDLEFIQNYQGYSGEFESLVGEYEAEMLGKGAERTDSVVQ